MLNSPTFKINKTEAEIDTEDKLAVTRGDRVGMGKTGEGDYTAGHKINKSEEWSVHIGNLVNKLFVTTLYGDRWTYLVIIL